MGRRRLHVRALARVVRPDDAGPVFEGGALVEGGAVVEDGAVVTAALRDVHRCRDDAGVAVEGRALGVVVRLVVTDPAVLAGATELLAVELEAVDRACSRFRADSELVALDRSAGSAVPVGPVHVGPVLAAALAAALEVAAATDGDVDPTVGSAMVELGYDRDFARLPVVGAPVRVVAVPVPGWRQVRFDPTTSTVALPRGVRLDLGASAKAWAADRIAKAVVSRFGCGALVALGGDVAVAGEPPDGGWRVGIGERPDDVPGEVVTVTAGGVATSSTSARRWVRGERVLHHVLDPRTGLPTSGPWRTVTVTAASCLHANAASTAALVRGAAAPAWLSGLGLPARLVDTSGHVTRVGGWPTAPATGTATSARAVR